MITVLAVVTACVVLLNTVVGLLTKVIELRLAAAKAKIELPPTPNQEVRVESIARTENISPKMKRVLRTFAFLDSIFGVLFFVGVLGYFYVKRDEPITRFDLLIGLLAAGNYALTYIDIKARRRELLKK